MFSTCKTHVLAMTLVLSAGVLAHLCTPVEAAMQSIGAQGAPSTATASLAEVSGVTLTNAQQSATVSIQTAGDIVYKSFTMKKSAMIVVDVYGAVNKAVDAGGLASETGLVKRVRAAQYAVEPQAITRVVIELTSLTPFTAKRSESGIQIDFAGGAKVSDVAVETTPGQTVDATSAPAPVAVQQPAQEPDALAMLDSSLETMKGAELSSTVPVRPFVNGRAAIARFIDAAQPVNPKGLTTSATVASSAAASKTFGFMKSATHAAAQHQANVEAARIEADTQRLAQELAALEAAQENKRKILEAESAVDEQMTAIARGLEEVQIASVDVLLPTFQVFGAQAAEDAAPADAAPASEAPVEPAPSERPAPSGKAVVERLQTLVGEPTEEAVQQGGVKEMETAAAAEPAATATPLPASTSGDPLDKIVNLDFRETELSNVVALLAQIAQVNVIGGSDLQGTVTAKIKNLPLRQAFEIVLEMNGLGIIEDKGVFKIVPLTEAKLADRVQELVFLSNAKALEVAKTLDGVIIGSSDQELIAITPNESTNVVVIAGPVNRVSELSMLAKRLDVAEPALPTVTEAIRLDYAETKDILPVVETMLTETTGKADQDPTSRSVIVTDVPVVVEQIREMVKSLDRPVKQVQIKAMIVDAVLRDASQFGTDWTVNLLPSLNSRGETIGNLEDMSLSSGNARALGTDALDSGVFSFHTLSSKFDIEATIAAEVASRNAEILANPTVVTVENKKANILITQEFPYQKLTQSTTGPPISSTEFKDIGVTLAVTPRVTNDDHIITDIDAKQSSISGLSSGVPIEDKRQATTTLRTKSGQTAFIGGLRNISDRLEISKIPLLGDVPVLNFLFKNTQTDKINTELLIFLTCFVIDPELPKPTEEQQVSIDKLGIAPKVPDGQRAAFRHMLRPQEMRDPFWKWSRTD